jgi:alpha-tubulin suppressor-like RCC1 family protein
VLFENGAVRCWGAVTGAPGEDPPVVLGTSEVAYTAPNTEGRRFVIPADTGDVILPDPDEDPAVQISAASDGRTTCALLSSGNVSCWGDNASGQLGVGDTRPSDPEIETLRSVVLGERAIEVRSGFDHTCVLTENGRVRCWGKGDAGRLGYGDTEPLFSPKTGDGAYVDIGGPAMGLALGHDHTCALLEAGAVRCWGENDLGQLGYGHKGRIGADETPAQAAAGLTEPMTGRPLGGDVDFGPVAMKQIVALAPSRSTCALSTDGNVWCWGQNDFGELGYGHDYDGAIQYTPRELADEMLGGAVFVGGTTLALAEGGRCALRTDGELYCWGLNDHGQLGLGYPEGGFDVSTRYRPGDTFPVHW